MSIFTLAKNGFAFKFDADDVVDEDSFIPHGEFNPHNIHPWLIHAQGIVLAVVFASNEQDALDAAVDGNKLNSCMVKPEDLDDYKTGEDSEGNPEYGDLAFLGNASEPFNLSDIDLLSVSAASWGIQYWTEEQIKNRISTATDRLSIDSGGSGVGACGLRESAIDTEIEALRSCVKELAARRLAVAVAE